MTFRDQLGDIVDYIDQLRGYPALAEDAAESPVAEADDRPGECLPWPAVEGNAPETLDRFLVVPQVKAGDD